MFGKYIMKDLKSLKNSKKFGNTTDRERAWVGDKREAHPVC